MLVLCLIVCRPIVFMAITALVELDLVLYVIFLAMLLDELPMVNKLVKVRSILSMLIYKNVEFKTAM